MKSTDKVFNRGKQSSKSALEESGFKFQRRNTALTSKTISYRMAPESAQKMQLLKENLGISYNDIIDRCVLMCLDKMLEENGIVN